MSEPQPPRYVPDRPLPPYTFVPGRSPHPVSDPAGHQFGQTPEAPGPLDADTWQTNRAYLYGIDLFNHGYYWEAHEAWESLWHLCGRKGTTADFLKGLIKLAAAGVKHRQGTPAGVRSHTRRAADLFTAAARSPRSETDFYLGLRVTDLIALAKEIGRDGWPARQVFLRPAGLPA